MAPRPHERADASSDILYHYVNADAPMMAPNDGGGADTMTALGARARAFDMPSLLAPGAASHLASGRDYDAGFAYDVVAQRSLPSYALPSRVVVGVAGVASGASSTSSAARPVVAGTMAPCVDEAPRTDVLDGRRGDGNASDGTERTQLGTRSWGAVALRDPLAALAFVLSLAYLAYLTAASAREGNADYIFALARALTSARARAVVFEFPLLRRALARLGGSLTLAAAVATLPVTLAALVCVRTAGRVFVAGACFGALALALFASLRGAAFFFETDAVVLALLLVCVAFIALVLIYALYVGRDALCDYGRLLEDAAAIVFSALPGLCAATLVVGALYVGFFVWWGLTLAALLTSDVGVLFAGALDTIANESLQPLSATSLLTASLGAENGVAARAVVFVGGSAFNVYFCVALVVWVANVLNGVMRVAVAGGASAWRARRSASAGVLAALVRALTLSLGTLALAAVLVSVVEWTHAVVARSRSLLKRSCAGGPPMVPLKIVLMVLRTVLRYVNSYVYVEIAESGCSFWDASRRVCRRFSAAPSKAVASYATTAYVLVALRAVVAGGAVLVAALVRAPLDASGAPLALAATLATRQALAAYAVAYAVAALPTAWLETAAHARLVYDVESEASEQSG